MKKNNSTKRPRNLWPKQLCLAILIITMGLPVQAFAFDADIGIGVEPGSVTAMNEGKGASESSEPLFSTSYQLQCLIQTTAAQAFGTTAVPSARPPLDFPPTILITDLPHSCQSGVEHDRSSDPECPISPDEQGAFSLLVMPWLMASPAVAVSQTVIWILIGSLAIIALAIGAAFLGYYVITRKDK
jgi:hypothetical protein